MRKKPEKNQFFDINKLPREWGIIVFPISMSRISNAQSPRACIDAMYFFTEKIMENKVGANFIYTEGLYMNFEKEAYETKNHFAQAEVAHMRGVRKLFQKDYRKFQIETALQFDSWFQMYLSHKDFFNTFKSVKDFYLSDKEFQRFLREDAKSQGRRLDQKQVNFFLEEHTFAYLLLNEQLSLKNDFVNGRERWILQIYPGLPPKGQVYLFQKDILGLGKLSSNPYKGQYDLLSKKFIDYDNVDLEKF